jgi:hypothetical protein
MDKHQEDSRGSELVAGARHSVSGRCAESTSQDASGSISTDLMEPLRQVVQHLSKIAQWSDAATYQQVNRRCQHDRSCIVVACRPAGHATRQLRFTHVETSMKLSSVALSIACHPTHPHDVVVPSLVGYLPRLYQQLGSLVQRPRRRSTRVGEGTTGQVRHILCKLCRIPGGKARGSGVAA